VRLINANGVLSLQHELDDVLSKENSASRRMMDVDNVMESLRRRVVELQGKLEAEMATAAQLPDALDQVRRKGQSQQVVANASRAGF
jgi:predicted  nucleic acid-binding Zn-ribbon protein